MLEYRAIQEIDTTIAIFEMITEDECFKTDITKISEDLSSDYETFFPDWFSLKGMNDIYKLILSGMERSILLKFRQNITNLTPTTYSLNTRNIALSYLKNSDQ